MDKDPSHVDSGHDDSGHQDMHVDSGHHTDSGHQDSGHVDSGNHQDTGHEDTGHVDSGHDDDNARPWDTLEETIDRVARQQQAIVAAVKAQLHRLSSELTTTMTRIHTRIAALEGAVSSLQGKRTPRK